MIGTSRNLSRFLSFSFLSLFLLLFLFSPGHSFEQDVIPISVKRPQSPNKNTVITDPYLARICKGIPAHHCVAALVPFDFYRLRTPPRIVDATHSVSGPTTYRFQNGSQVSVNEILRSLGNITTTKWARDEPQLLRAFPWTSLDYSDQCHLYNGRDCAPMYVVIGEAKCGTTALFNYLAMHPNIRHGRVKEIVWGTVHLHLPKIDKRTGAITGIVNPLYAYGDDRKQLHMFKKIRQAFPNTKLIYIMRNPVNRAISHYLFKAKDGYYVHEPNIQLPISTYFDMEWMYLHQCWKDGVEWLKCADYYNFTVPMNYPMSVIGARRKHYSAMGLYYHTLRYWYKEFPPDNVLIMNFEYYVKNTQDALNSIFNFLGVPPIGKHLVITPHNAGRPVEEYEPPSPKY